MVGQHIREDLRRPLDGNRRWITEQRGLFTLRVDPEHVAEALSERARLRVQEDIRNFRREHNRRRNLDALA